MTDSANRGSAGNLREIVIGLICGLFFPLIVLTLISLLGITSRQTAAIALGLAGVAIALGMALAASRVKRRPPLYGSMLVGLALAGASLPYFWLATIA